jgi:hypothetical protein
MVLFIRWYFPVVFFLLFETLFSVQIDSLVNQFYLFHGEQSKPGPYPATFFQLVEDAEQVPLNIHLGLGVQGGDWPGCPTKLRV